MAKKIALGKGIGSLISGANNESVLGNLKNRMAIEGQEGAGGAVQNTSVETQPSMIEISQIKTNPNQPRKIFKDKELEELSNSIKENGVIQPVIVVQTDNGFELVAGERRLRASKLAGLTKIPVVVKRATDREKMIMAIIENVQRSDLNCVEEALAYYQLMDEYKLTQEEVGKKLGKERSTVANFLRILKLPRDVIELLQKELLSFGHAKVLASEKDRERAIRFANLAVRENLSVRELEKQLKKKLSVKADKETNPFFDEKLDGLKQKLENKTGFHFNINSKKNGGGEVSLKFSNEAEFNDIFEYLMNR
ncbi:ParB/RepB/Spo0J family partition protein [Halobacteriovorax sp. HLS]|uniref:ParB/RepB/Spo0J family partition protein n=1 Tax=Halobacteriovorax sp. HLS TaxID=2234000 RepID=UPI000FDC1C0C|nr:ParB/RepB/Spo0J family partition protein [Halobacteriovorax sp. HLS]